MVEGGGGGMVVGWPLLEDDDDGVLPLIWPVQGYILDMFSWFCCCW